MSSLVEEVERSLTGLGFDTSVVTGKDARAALVDRRRTQTPTIYVVCVQGDLKDTVLGPLRQALATHAGPNEHLFVAVLDLSLPLSMVGQVRRFAEALERAPVESRSDPLHERRQWREHSGNHSIDEADTRSYRTVSRPSSNTRGTGAHPIIATRKPARISPTRKYRALTAPALPTQSKPNPAPKSRSGGTQRVEVDAPRTVRKQIKVPGLQTRTVAESGEFGAATKFGAAIAGDAASESKGFRWGTLLLVLLVLAAAAAATYFLGGFDRFLLPEQRPDGAQTVANAEANAQEETPEEPAAVDEEPPSEPEDNPDSGANEDAVPAVEAEDADEEGDEAEEGSSSGEADEEEPAAAEDDDEDPVVVDDDTAEDETDEDEPADDETAQDEPSDDEPASDKSVEDEPTLDEPATPAIEEALAPAIERRDVLVSNKYYVTTPEPARAGWGGARKLCRDLDVESIDEWRLPYRRELQLLGAIGMLTRGKSFWSRTVDVDDSDYAFVYERKNRRLTSWEKSENADVVCVLKRN